ncbi:MAG: biotin transporter BioY, partial [Lachnospiraceae bacterium]|nr:biotin transporter BioY [Lachnospiraceae bacterium]
AVGLPVFSGFKGGFGVLLGSTGGYIIGFILMGLIYALMTGIFGNKLMIEILSLVIGLIVCYAFGTVWFMTVYMRETGPIGVMAVLGWCVFPFIIPDLVKMAMAFFIAKRLRPVMGK